LFGLKGQSIGAKVSLPRIHKLMDQFADALSTTAKCRDSRYEDKHVQVRYFVHQLAMWLEIFTTDGTYSFPAEYNDLFKMKLNSIPVGNEGRITVELPVGCKFSDWMETGVCALEFKGFESLFGVTGFSLRLVVSRCAGSISNALPEIWFDCKGDFCNELFTSYELKYCQANGECPSGTTCETQGSLDNSFGEAFSPPIFTSMFQPAWQTEMGLRVSFSEYLTEGQAGGVAQALTAANSSYMYTFRYLEHYNYETQNCHDNQGQQVCSPYYTTTGTSMYFFSNAAEDINFEYNGKMMQARHGESIDFKDCPVEGKMYGRRDVMCTNSDSDMCDSDKAQFVDMMNLIYTVTERTPVAKYADKTPGVCSIKVIDLINERMEQAATWADNQMVKTGNTIRFPGLVPFTGAHPTNPDIYFTGGVTSSAAAVVVSFISVIAALVLML